MKSIKVERNKYKTEPEDLVNWAALSRYMAGARTSIQKNRIPEKHFDRIQFLMCLIEKWMHREIEPEVLPICKDSVTDGN